MCIFSQPVESVASTHIFVRWNPQTRRVATVYQMEAALMSDAAMILPVPGSHVEFVNLEGYPEFFKDMDKLFPEPTTKSITRGIQSFTLGAADTLEVHDVGQYIASYVPTMDDWDRVDSVFRLPENCWAELPDYNEFGFVVFQLKVDHQNFLARSKSYQRTKKYHPMAYTYSVDESNSLFFPTTHVHDGEVEENSDYDHKLYFQLSDEFHELPKGSGLEWRFSERMPSGAMAIGKCEGLVSPVTPIARCTLKRKYPNSDLIIQGGEMVTMLRVPVRGKQETFGVNDFANDRHFDATKGFTWTDLSHEKLLKRVAENWEKREPGQGETTTNRKVVVPIDTERVYSAYTKIEPNMSLVSSVAQRQEDEDYFVETRLADGLTPVERHHNKPKFAKVVMYSKEALLENGGTRTTQADWEMVCLIASDVETEPMHPLAMARNMLEKPGGTASTYSAKEFAEAIYYWSQRVKT